MFSNKFIFKLISLSLVAFALTSCSDKAIGTSTQTNSEKNSPLVLEVYKSPTCGCCEKWISHIDENGFEPKIHNFQDLSFIKENAGIKPKYQSCHTAISKEGYVFEGHIPAKFIKQFMNEPHSAEVIGISVPDMPMGSPGMEYNDKFMPYEILLLKANGTHEVYKSIKSYEEQY